MTSGKPINLNPSHDHSTAWVTQVWLSFIISIAATMIGIIYAPVNSWVRAYLGMGLVFSVGSSLSLAKTTRDLHESKKVLSRIDEAKLERLLAQHDPYQQ
ncbi:YiaA/YiaB family inner membrane protein [Alkalinema sp. FACHB-956]|uniref:YiaA/YiaB family inner membrane protein n=1 Tax=Alkalinema sp. FACHB-956 TaxID=2692768 RepID=UPI00168454CE|nr:YiaA/YiaB family inner membrane protein [Alkalinema sp. FACHB-956]MBD2327653.1 hypothetical protein [Alkalinema sp. FACHB-956]